MTVVRITIRKKLTKGVAFYLQSKSGLFSNEYVVQTDAPFPSPQLKEYAINLATAESRIYPSCICFDSAVVKLATPGASPESLRGRYSNIDLPKLCGQVAMAEDDTLAYPPVAASYIREASRGRGGRLVLPYILTTAEWNLYIHKRVEPARFPRYMSSSLAPPVSFSQDLLDAVRDANGSHVMSSAPGEKDPELRQVRHFFFDVFQVSSTKRKKRPGYVAKQNAEMRAMIQRLKEESDPSAIPTPANKRSKSKSNSEGVVYLLKAGPHFKIGKSVVFDKRLGQIKLQLPYAVEVVHTIQAANVSEVESYWHRRFASLRQNGEWFLLTETEVEEFKSMSNM